MQAFGDLDREANVMCEAKLSESSAENASEACQRNTNLRSSAVVSAERLAMNEVQGLNKNFDSNGMAGQPLATSQAYVSALT